MKVMKITALAVALVALAALAPSVSGRFDSPLLAQSRDRSREVTILGGRGGELGVRIMDAPAGGVEIREVDPDGAADKAGLKRGDIIVEFDGERVRSSRQLARLVQETPAGRSVEATVTRDGRRQDVQITPSEGRGSSAVVDGGHFFDVERWREQFGGLEPLRPFDFNFNIQGMLGGGRLGVTVDDLTRQLADYFGAKDGVLVTSVTDGSAAAKAGIKAGDVITSVNGRSITSREELLRVLRDVDNEEVTIGIVRDKKETTLKAKIEPARRSLRGARPI